MIVQFPRHKYETCRGKSCTGCVICDGGLSVCETCGGAEASLPTDCPGEQLPGILLDEIQAGRINYTRKLGWYKC